MKTKLSGETDEYRRLRDNLLKAEIELKDQHERVAELRRELPMGRCVETDYIFHEGPANINDDLPNQIREVSLSQLFEPSKDSLIVDHMMWDPADAAPCPMCNMWADGYNAVTPHVADKVNFVLISKVQIERLREWGRGRGWNKIRLLSSYGNDFNKNFGVEDKGGQRPAVSVFRKSPDGKIFHFYTTEASLGEGHHRGIDLFSPVWNLFDLLPEGREMWMPKRSY